MWNMSIKLGKINHNVTNDQGAEEFDVQYFHHNTHGRKSTIR